METIRLESDGRLRLPDSLLGAIDWLVGERLGVYAWDGEIRLRRIPPARRVEWALVAGCLAEAPRHADV